MKEETPVQIDGKFSFVAPFKILKAVVIPGKLVNLLTEIPDPEKCVSISERRTRAGKTVKTVKYGSKVPPEKRIPV